MNEEHKIGKGGLSGKLGDYRAEPPAEVWDGISARLHGGSSRRYLIIALSVAAGLALLVTAGIALFQPRLVVPLAEQSEILELTPGRSEGVDTSAGPVNQPVSPPVKLLLQTESVASEVSNVKQNTRSARLEKRVLTAMKEVASEITPDEDQMAIHTTAKQDVVPEGIDEGLAFAKDTVLMDENPAAEVDQMLAVAQSLPDQFFEDEEDKSRWQIGASLSPAYSYRDASSSDRAQNQAVNNVESGVLTYSAGVRVSYMQSERISFESGIYYNRMGLSIGDYTAFFGERLVYDNINASVPANFVSVSNSVGTIVSGDEAFFINSYQGSEVSKDYNLVAEASMQYDNEVIQSFTQSLQYLEIPFNIRYKFLDRELDLLLIGGVSTNLLLGSDVTAFTSNSRIEVGEIEDIRTLNYSGNAGVGVLYQFPGNFSLSIEPRFRYYLHSVNSPALPSTRPYAFGIYTGLNYRF